MSVVDPALLSSFRSDREDSDWEYEYHDTESVTFLLSLDLTTHHGPIRAPRRRNEASASVTSTAVNATNPIPAPPRPDDQDPAVTNTETDNKSAERFQILGLHTPNPIISYQNQIFSGSWADQLGTELFFAHSGMTGSEFDDLDLTHTSLKHTKDFDLISANNVKILARKANLISSSGLAASTQREAPSLIHTSTPDTSTLVYKPEHQSNQSRFLDQLKELKRRRGETDAVRIVFSTHRRGPNLEERLRGWVQTEEQLAVIQQLNGQAVLGDMAAVRELERMYAQLGG
ncbi:hypothetical protein BJX70DRAFT_221260 [Aspergillus crustosus]